MSQVVDRPGANRLSGQDTAERECDFARIPCRMSISAAMSVPLLVTVYAPGLVVDFTTVKCAPARTVTDADDGSETTGAPFGGVPVAVALLVTTPATASARVVTYVAVHVSVCCGATVVAGQVGVGGVPVPENAVSVTCTFVSVVLPVFRTRYV